MMELVVHSGDETLASVEPESLQVLTYLQLCDTPKSALKVTSSCFPWTSEYPVLRDGSRAAIMGSEAIIAYLKEHGYNIDKLVPGFDEVESMAYSALLKDKLFPAIVYLQWLESRNFVEVTRKWYGKVLYFPLSIFVPLWKHNSWKRRLLEGTPQDYVQQKGIELLKRAEDGVVHLSSRLGENEYFFGNKPSSLDALVFGYLEVIFQQWPSDNNSLASRAQACTNLKQFCSRIHLTCFPEFKPRMLQVAAPTPSRPLWKDPTLWLSVIAAGGILSLQGIRVGLFHRIRSWIQEHARN